MINATKKPPSLLGAFCLSAHRRVVDIAVDSVAEPLLCVGRMRRFRLIRSEFGPLESAVL